MSARISPTIMFILVALGRIAADAQTKYTVTDIGRLANGNAVYANAINNSGEVVGGSADHVFLYDGAMHDLGVFPGDIHN